MTDTAGRRSDGSACTSAYRRNSAAALGAGLWGVGVVDVSRIEPLCDRDGREHVRRMKHRLATQTADASLLEHALIALDPRRLALPIDDLRHAPAFNAVGAVDVGDRLQQPLALPLRHARQHTSIGG